jgi:hypothetical protein
MDDFYKDFPIRDQDTEVRQVLDLLQGWGAPAREPLGTRLRRNLAAAAAWLSLHSPVRRRAGCARQRCPDLTGN